MNKRSARWQVQKKLTHEQEVTLHAHGIRLHLLSVIRI